MKKALKRLLKKSWVLSILAKVGAAYLRFIYYTSSWTVEGEEPILKMMDEKKPFLLCFWHGRLMMLMFAYKYERPLHMIISAHQDGKFIAAVLRCFGMNTIEGSSTRKGSEAFRNSLRCLKKGNVVGVTPDGPKGPAFSVKDGLVRAAYRAQVPVVTLTYSVKKGTILKTWDKFLLAKPFNQGVFKWGKPIYPPPQNEVCDLHPFKRVIEDSLNNLCVQVDKKMGRGK